MSHIKKSSDKGFRGTTTHLFFLCSPDETSKDQGLKNRLKRYHNYPIFSKMFSKLKSPEPPWGKCLNVQKVQEAFICMNKGHWMPTGTECQIHFSVSENLPPLCPPCLMSMQSGNYVYTSI